MNCTYTCHITTQPAISPYKAVIERHNTGNNFCLEFELPLTLGVLVIGLPLDHSWTGAN